MIRKMVVRMLFQVQQARYLGNLASIATTEVDQEGSQSLVVDLMIIPLFKLPTVKCVKLIFCSLCNGGSAIA